ncbi:gastrula zinc finger protein XlCGF46.1-like [Mercenaria mercenaria]|uniref:gastrula zinc finger protein XlCGF46.1-like n=1 Tax=Mercenaria mercenaria TaxID=6596 RepID=UPI00234EC800|nr:gastrula zinc finger protein XlCGF46.1-like [Mercenaria mercenaria]
MAEKMCIENPTESQETSSDEIKECDPCLISDKSSPAGKYCSECEENLCEDCARNHSKRKATSSHKLILIQETHSDTYLLCNPCTDNEKVSKAVSFCDMCEEYLCNTCTQSHKIRKATRLHEPINIEELNRYKKSAEKIPSCALCEESGIRSTASYYCEECEEYLCEMCKESHSIRKATKLHRPVPASSLKSNDSDEKTEKEESSKMCDPCTFLNKRVVAISFCTQCEELLCADCTNLHRIRKLTKAHALKRPESAEADKVECGICERRTDQRTVMYCNTCEEKLCRRCAN